MKSQAITIPLTPSALAGVAEREVEMRRKVYQSRVSARKMKAEEASFEIGAMRKIADIMRLIRDDADLQDRVRKKLEREK